MTTAGSQESAAFNTGIYTTFNDPDSTYACIVPMVIFLMMKQGEIEVLLRRFQGAMQGILTYCLKPRKPQHQHAGFPYIWEVV